MTENDIEQHPDTLRAGENPEVNNVSGYRKLCGAELHLVNKIKAHGPVLEQLLTDIDELVSGREDPYHPESHRALALGKTNVQQGFMWLIRAVAAPNGLV